MKSLPFFLFICSCLTASAATTQLGIPIQAGCTAPSISVQPSSVVCITNTTTSFEVTASGTPPLAYQWRAAGTNLANSPYFAGVTAATLYASNVTASTPTNYTVVITNACGGITSQIATLTATNGVPGGALTNNLVDFWHFDESGVLTAASSFGYSNSWTMQAGMIFASPGVKGGYLNFNGASDWATIADGTAPYDTTYSALSFAGYVRGIYSNPGSYTIIEKMGAASERGWQINILQNGVVEPDCFDGPSGTEFFWDTGQIIPEDTWVHLGVVISSVGVLVTTNGVLAYTNGPGPTQINGANNTGLRIGANRAGGDIFDAKMDEMGIWLNRALTEAELNQVYTNLGIPPGVP